MMKACVHFLLGGAVLLCIDPFAQARTWSDRGGRFKIEAEFESLEDGIVTLRRTDAKVVRVPLNKLSDEDQIEVKRLSVLAETDSPIHDSTGPKARSPEKPEEDNATQMMTVVVEGSGENDDAALKNAFRAAVRQVVGAVVDAETLVKNDELIEDKILTYSDGFVKTWKEVPGSRRHRSGFIQLKIQAQVERRSVVARLTAANVSVREVDGKGLFAEVVSKLEGDEDAAALVQKAFADYPVSVIQAVVHEKPSVETEADETVMNYKLSVSVNREKYDMFQKRTVEMLRKIARRKGECSEVADTRTLKQTHKSWSMPVNRKGFGKAWWKGSLSAADDIVVVINTKRNSLNDRTTWEWFHVPRPGGSGNEIGPTFDKAVRVDVLFQDSSGEEVFRDSLILNDTESQSEFNTPGLYSQGNFSVEGYVYVPFAIVSPYYFFQQGDFYEEGVVAVRKVSVGVDDLKRIAAIKTVVTVVGDEQ